jgi:hypothetical protein
MSPRRQQTTEPAVEQTPRLTTPIDIRSARGSEGSAKVRMFARGSSSVCAPDCTCDTVVGGWCGQLPKGASCERLIRHSASAYRSRT